MRASINWIKELLPELRATPAAIEKRLTGAGLEVEELIEQSAAFQGIVVGEVKDLSPHPKADRLQLATVFDGERDVRCVCGAKNVAVGQKVAFARVGSTLPNGLTIEKREIRGQTSEGMICSEAELGVADSSDGILVLRSRAKPGGSIAGRIGMTDVLLEISVTPNRPDVLSHFGLARELAALYGLAAPKLRTKVKQAGEPASTRAKIEIRAGSRCPRYIGRVIEGVKIGPSPEWLVRRLEAVGLRSISNVVDATNLVLLELGHPLHAFDLAKLGGQKIIVRNAKEGEKLTTLDGVDRKLSADDLVIADNKRPVALAGVMGGGDSEVSDETVDILLESAMFDPRTVRRTSKRHGLHTEASHRFERGADPLMLDGAVDRCAQLITDLAGGRVLPGRIEVVKHEFKPSVVPIRTSRATTLLGRPVDAKEVRAALGALGMKPAKAPQDDKRKAKKKGKKTAPAKLPKAMYFSVPSWRVDLVREVDLIEEVARVGGYDSIPTLMPPLPSDAWTEGLTADPLRAIRTALVGEGFHEAISLAFNSRAQLDAVGGSIDRAVTVHNPLGEESAFMRMSLLPALLRAARHNQGLMTTDLRLFELGNTFEWGASKSDLPVETRRVGLLMRGRRHPASWTDGERGPLVDPYDLKGVLEALLERLEIRTLRCEATTVSWLHPTSATAVFSGDVELGRFGEIHPDVAKAFDLDGPSVLVAELDVDALVGAQQGYRAFSPLPKYPAISRDLSFFIRPDVLARDVLSSIQKAAGSLLEEARVFDVFDKGQKRSMAVRMVFRSEDRTLRDSEVDEAQARVMAGLQKDVGADLRVN